MKLAGLHLLLTYECNYECDHCFVWGGPRQSGTMTIEIIERILEEAEALGTVEWIYFEGGEAFLHYELLRAGVRSGRGARLRRGNRDQRLSGPARIGDAIEWLQPFAGLVKDLSASAATPTMAIGNSCERPRVARDAAEKLGNPGRVHRRRGARETRCPQRIGPAAGG